MTADNPIYTWLGVFALVLLAGGAITVVVAVRNAKQSLLQRLALLRQKALTGTPGRRAAGPELVRIENEASAPREQREFARRLGKWHVTPANAFAFYTIMRLVLAIVFFAAGLLFIRASLLGILIDFALGVGGWFIPALAARSFIKNRTRAVVDGLPEALELMVVCVDAGLALEDTLDRVTAELALSQPILAEELAITSADLKVLPSREEALLGLAKRVDAPSVRSMIMTLSQTMRYGTPLAQALRTVASELRNDSLIRLEERANMLPTLLTVPMMIFIMPTIFLIVGGPAALRIVDTFLR